MQRAPLSQVTAATFLAVSMLGCSHSDSFTTASSTLSVPMQSTPPIRLTYNAGDNYWPSWTEDGRGIIYHYSYPSPDIHADDRCVGLLPPSGGTRLWQMCDERPEHADSADSFAGAAIGADGRLIYLEVSSRRGPGGLSGPNQPPQTIVLWLADTAFPFQRRKLLDFGFRLADTFVNWLRDTQWTGQTSFVSLAMFADFRQGNGSRIDSVFTGLGVVHGEISSTGATLTFVPGTEGAQMYSFAENGASFIIYRSGSSIERVPVAGGTPSTVATLPGALPTGLTCQGSTCLVTTGHPGSPQSIYRVALTTGEAVPLTAMINDSPRLPPTGTTLVGRNGRSLYLFSGLLP